LLRKRELELLSELERWSEHKEAGRHESAESQLGLVRERAGELFRLRKALGERSYIGQAFDLQVPED
jgi:hypothetical protein